MHIYDNKYVACMRICAQMFPGPESNRAPLRHQRSLDPGLRRSPEGYAYTDVDATHY